MKRRKGRKGNRDKAWQRRGNAAITLATVLAANVAVHAQDCKRQRAQYSAFLRWASATVVEHIVKAQHIL